MSRKQGQTTSAFDDAFRLRPAPLTIMADEPEVVYLPGLPIPQPIQPLDFTPFRDSGVPIIIDNGSSNLRYGLATEAPGAVSPRLDPFSGPNVVARFKDRKTNQQVLLFGDNVEFDSGARAQARNPWEGDVLLNFDALVSCFRLVFLVLLYKPLSFLGEIGKCS